jgi:hypothetical protein
MPYIDHNQEDKPLIHDVPRAARGEGNRWIFNLRDEPEVVKAACGYEYVATEIEHVPVDIPVAPALVGDLPVEPDVPEVLEPQVIREIVHVHHEPQIVHQAAPLPWRPLIAAATAVSAAVTVVLNLVT